MSTRRVDVVQYGWNMFDRRMQQEIFPYCEEQGIGFMAYGSLAFGLLTGTFTEDMDFGSVRLARPPGEDGLDQDVRLAVRRGVVPAQRPRGRRAEGHRRHGTARACRSSRCAGRPRTRRSAPRSSAAAPSPRSRTTSARSAGRSATRTSPRWTRSSPGTASTPSRTTGSRNERNRSWPARSRSSPAAPAASAARWSSCSSKRAPRSSSPMSTPSAARRWRRSSAKRWRSSRPTSRDAGPGAGARRLHGRALRRAARHVQQRRDLRSARRFLDDDLTDFHRVMARQRLRRDARQPARRAPHGRARRRLDHQHHVDRRHQRGPRAHGLPRVEGRGRSSSPGRSRSTSPSTASG